jgi:hypothetical protein
MDEKQTDLRENRLEITSGGHSFVVIWAVCLLILYVAGAFLGAVKLRGYAA